MRNTSHYMLLKVEELLWMLFIFFGFWTLGCNVFVYFKFSYLSLYYFFWGSLFSAPIFFWIIENHSSPKKNETPTNGQYNLVTQNEVIYLFIVIIILYLSIKFLPYFISWVILIIFCIFFLKRSHLKSSEKCEIKKLNDISPTFTFSALFLLCLAAIFLTSFAIRQDNDDAYYLSMIVQQIDKPWLPALFFEPMYGLTESVMAMIRRVHSYELLIGIFSIITNFDHLTIYYIIFPAASCFVLIFSLFAISRKLLLSDKAALFSVFTIVLVLVVWADGHRTYGNFSFVRFFQGKSLLIQIFIPMIVYTTWLFIRFREVRYIFFCALISIGSIGVSINAILLSPLAILFALIGGTFVFSKVLLNKRILIFVVFTCAYPILIALLIKLNPGGGSIVHHFGRELSDALPDSKRIYGIVLGDNALNFRSAFALGCLVTFPLFLTNRHWNKIAAGFVLLSVIILLAPGYPLHYICAKYASSNFIWRLSWIIPFPLVFGLTLGAIINTNNHKLILIIPLLMLPFILTNEKTTFSKDNKAYFAIQNHKFNNDLFKEVKSIKMYIPNDGLIIAPENISVIMASLRDFPPKAYVRNAYLRRLNPDKRKEIAYLVKIINRYSKKDDALKFIKIIDKYRIQTIIFRRKGKLDKSMSNAIEKRGFNNVRNFKDYKVWSRDSAHIHAK